MATTGATKAPAERRDAVGDLPPWRTRMQAPRYVALGSVAMVVIVLLIWEVASRAIFVLDPPAQSLPLVIDNLRDPVYRLNARTTALTILTGFVIGVSAGAVLGMVLGLVPLARRSVEPAIVAIHAVPKIIIYPVLIGIFGIGATSKIAVGSIHAFFPIMMIVAAGTSAIPPVYLKVARSLEATPAQTLFRIIIPAVLRPIVTGLRLGISVATIGVVLAEFFVTRLGLGRIMRRNYEFGQHDELMASVVLLLVVTFAISFALWRVERRLHTLQ